MTTVLEDRLAAIEAELESAKNQLQSHHSSRRKKHRKRLIALAALTIFLFGGVAIAWFRTQRHSQPIPTAVVQDLPFPVYFPADPPDGFAYSDGSARKQAGTLLYQIRSGHKAFTIVQQAKPEGLANLKSMEGLSETAVKIGRGFIGSSGDPRAVIISDKSLVTIGGTGGATTADIMAVINSLEDLRQ